ncbi:molybdenum cofactor synthesis domain [Alkaliphilus metalliredigens QYMF]|uniref:Molybdopterin molybdenumtransferase n=1 Tax=Alkaliphilus metalliredigens (strain QYMF) TaxID=293826 RepID=A6TSY9_ALKMQ|nr:molybdopterin biosynthesis protein [Alkaliphilus metalliredigens]ABR49307.1 molybdenum cofactor synthesis domain [Alkaliphilus metalliredigens QYMF]
MEKKERSLYLTSIPLEEVRGMYLKAIEEHGGIPEKKEEISVEESLNRITTDPIFAKKSSPNYNAAAMDGVAIICSRTYGVSEKEPIRLISPRDFIYINTGGVIQEPYDGVIMIEDIVEIDQNTIEIHEAAKPWQHIRPIGEDIIEGELIIPANHKIRPMDMGALMAGHMQVLSVYPKPSVGIIPTGSEIVSVNDELMVGKIIESNGTMFKAFVEEGHGVANLYGITPDDPDILKESIKKALKENDCVLINAGSSAGSKDYTVNVLREMGVVIAHGVAIKPGKPVILAIVDNKPVIGIPGYPVSAYFVFEFFVKPLLDVYHRQIPQQKSMTKAILSRRVVSSLKHEEFIRMKLGLVGQKMIATPLDRGAGATMSLVKADGILIVPQRREGYEAGSEVDIQLLKPIEEIKQTIVSIGSHDVVMDLLANQLHQTQPDLFLSSAHVGSLGGIMALKKKECHMAPIHLLDEQSGEYNEAYVKRYIGSHEMMIIKFVKRSQGLMVSKGNPKNINRIKDLVRKDIRFVNRQRGAGTRILLEYFLKEEEVDPEGIVGYDRELTTHMAVAMAVASGSADTGLGVYSAAKAMGLDFIPIAWEDYDLCLPAEMLGDQRIQSLIETIKKETFLAQVNALGGYDTSEIGNVVKI